MWGEYDKEEGGEEMEVNMGDSSSINGNTSTNGHQVEFYRSDDVVPFVFDKDESSLTSLSHTMDPIMINIIELQQYKRFLNDLKLSENLADARIPEIPSIRQVPESVTKRDHCCPYSWIQAIVSSLVAHGGFHDIEESARQFLTELLIDYLEKFGKTISILESRNQGENRRVDSDEMPQVLLAFKLMGMPDVSILFTDYIERVRQFQQRLSADCLRLKDQLQTAKASSIAQREQGKENADGSSKSIAGDGDGNTRVKIETSE